MDDILKREYKEIAIDALVQGMRLYDDVINQFGNVLIPAKTEIANVEKIKNLLEHHNIARVKVVVKEDEVVEELDYDKMEENGDYTKIEEKLIELKIQEEIASFRQRFKDTQDSVQKGFEMILKGGSVSKDEIKSNINKTLESFQGSINVFQLLEKMKDLDDITYAHSQNVMVISHSIGKWLDLKDELIQSLVLSAMLIDVGKMKVSSDILNKKQRLTDDELLECHNHTVYSYEMIKSYDFINNDIKQAVLLHHERIDGSGYPLRLKGDKIPLLAKIVAIADVYNALTSQRPYRNKKSPFEAIKILETEYRDKLDLKIMYVFLNRIGNCFIGQKIKLNDGRIAEIVYVAKQNIYRPVVKLQGEGELIDLNIPQNAQIEIVDFI
ncbi:HD-GYP domain-containing protein [Alkaliphilus hydrothermalis]|uniref:HD-GYP domain-containing protein (C-di-GMP phosphodiesterase class II) n=1 Tax=Alkaliphilus hydrothermalis TaxID=1482730 RepID=A0ABS2NP82_9FIRM|nr:HD-GYP domain-containing protein [Alkaliphilus hydrothermalis]MBM7614753.1 HD-GYP domain-containing protein (c-di-GMP phosphodiesterase class II) [Alkaliphilus hydrothermalis]